MSSASVVIGALRVKLFGALYLNLILFVSKGTKKAETNLKYAKFLKTFFVHTTCISYRDFKEKRANCVDPDEMAHNEPPHMDLWCLQILLF